MKNLKSYNHLQYSKNPLNNRNNQLLVIYQSQSQLSLNNQKLKLLRRYLVRSHKFFHKIQISNLLLKIKNNKSKNHLYNLTPNSHNSNNHHRLLNHNNPIKFLNKQLLKFNHQCHLLNYLRRQSQISVIYLMKGKCYLIRQVISVKKLKRFRVWLLR